MRPGRLLPGLDFWCLHSPLHVPAARLSCLRCGRRVGGFETGAGEESTPGRRP